MRKEGGGMTKEQYYFTKLAEECSEVAQIALKTQQFGMLEKRQGQDLTNAERCHEELNDILAIVEVLNDAFGFGFTRNEGAIAAKKAKVLRYMKYSMDLGFVDIADNGGDL